MALTKQQIADIIREYKKGKSPYELSAKHNVAPGTIKYHLKRNNIELRSFEATQVEPPAKTKFGRRISPYNITVYEFNAMCERVIGETFDVDGERGAQKFMRVARRKLGIGGNASDLTFHDAMQELLKVNDILRKK